MKTFELNNTLETIPFSPISLMNNKQCVEHRLRIENDINYLNNPDDNVIFHTGYFGYLSIAWQQHYSIVLRPDDLWYIILSELTSTIKKDPTKYESLFTTNPGEKTEIVVLTNNVETIDPDAVIDILKQLVPSNVELFIPKFSTSTKMSILAMNVAFCDMVSPYYSYATMLCGIPNIRIEGTDDDWNLIVSSLKNMQNIFSDKIKQYLSKCEVEISNIILAIKNNNTDFFKKMIKLTPCGSGSDYEMSGWILNFLINSKNKMDLQRLPCNFSHMDYKNLETSREFTLYCGIFYSKIENEYLIPMYDAFRIENKIKTIPSIKVDYSSKKKLNVKWTSNVIAIPIDNRQ